MVALSVVIPDDDDIEQMDSQQLKSALQNIIKDIQCKIAVEKPIPESDGDSEIDNKDNRDIKDSINFNSKNVTKPNPWYRENEA